MPCAGVRGLPSVDQGERGRGCTWQCNCHYSKRWRKLEQQGDSGSVFPGAQHSRLRCSTAKPALAAGPITHCPSTFAVTPSHAGILAPAAGILTTARRGTKSRPGNIVQNHTAQTRAQSRPERSRSTPHSAHSAQLTRAESGCPDQCGAQTGPHNRDTHKHALRNGTECPGRGSAPLRRCRAAR